MADMMASKDAPMHMAGEKTSGSTLGIDDDPLSFESSAGDYLDIVGVPAEKRGKATKALKAAIMACMSEDYSGED